MLRRPLEPEQYLALRYGERLAEVGLVPSVGSVGDSYDNALAESTIGLFKTELVGLHGPWHTATATELAILGYIDWSTPHACTESSTTAPHARPRRPTTVTPRPWPEPDPTVDTFYRTHRGSFNARVRELRPVFLPPDPSGRTAYRPGELAQFDLWQPDVEIPLGHGQAVKLWVIVGVLCFSRLITAMMIPSRATHDVLAGHLACLESFGAVPRKVVWDGEGAIGRRRGKRTELTEAFQAFRGTLGMGAYICEKGDPEAKGVVERANGYLETSFLPGRTFTSLTDFNDQLAGWLELANARVHRITRRRPVDAAAEDRGAMRPLPSVLPEVAWRHTLRLPRDHYVRFDTCDYSIHPAAIGSWIDLNADLDWLVATTRDGREVARHRRSLAKHRLLSDPAHVRAANRLREAHRHTPATPADI